MYKLSPLNWSQTESTSVIDLDRMCAIPFSPDNTDYQQFLKDIKEGVELLDAEGNVVTDFVPKDKI